MLGGLVAGSASLLRPTIVTVFALLGQRPNVITRAVEHMPIEIHQAAALAATFCAVATVAAAIAATVAVTVAVTVTVAVAEAGRGAGVRLDIAAVVVLHRC